MEKLPSEAGAFLFWGGSICLGLWFISSCEANGELLRPGGVGWKWILSFYLGVVVLLFLSSAISKYEFNDTGCTLLIILFLTFHCGLAWRQLVQKKEWKQKKWKQEEEAWGNVNQKPSLENYKTYLNAYPRGRHTREAMDKIHELSAQEKKTEQK